MTVIGPKEAAQALLDIEQMVVRVRQSRTYDIASVTMILWGVLVGAGNIATFVSPPHGPYIWISVNAIGVIGSVAISVFWFPRLGGLDFDLRITVAFLLFFAF